MDTYSLKLSNAAIYCLYVFVLYTRQIGIFNSTIAIAVKNVFIASIIFCDSASPVIHPRRVSSETRPIAFNYPKKKKIKINLINNNLNCSYILMPIYKVHLKNLLAIHYSHHVLYVHDP